MRGYYGLENSGMVVGYYRREAEIPWLAIVYGGSCEGEILICGWLLWWVYGDGFGDAVVRGWVRVVEVKALEVKAVGSPAID